MAADDKTVRASEMEAALAPQLYSSPEIFALEARHFGDIAGTPSD